MEGPYGRLGLGLGRYSTLVCVSGGIGVTPAALLLDLALHPPSRRALLPRLRHLVWVWTVQSQVHPPP